MIRAWRLALSALDARTSARTVRTSEPNEIATVKSDSLNAAYVTRTNSARPGAVLGT